MKNSINITIPDFITQAFPILKEATYVREFASFITLYPDAVYYLFQTTSNQSLILVVVDYPDPTDDSRQVKSLSGGLYTSSSRTPTTSILKFALTTTWMTAFLYQTRRVVIVII